MKRLQVVFIFLFLSIAAFAQTPTEEQSVYDFYFESLQNDLKIEKEVLNEYGRISNEYISITWEIAQDYLGLHDSDHAVKYMTTCFLSMIRFYPENNIHPWQDERYHYLTETLFSLLDKSTNDSYQYKLEFFKTQFIDEELYGYESFVNLHKLTRFFLYHNDYRNVKDFSALLGELTLKHKGVNSQEYAEYLYYNIEAGAHSFDYNHAAHFIELAAKAKVSWDECDRNNYLISYASSSAYYAFKKYDLAQNEYARLRGIIDANQFAISSIQKANCYGLGSLIYLASDLSKAKECIDSAIQLREESGVYDYSGYRDLALYYKKIGEFELAIQAYFKAIDCITDDSFLELERKNQRARYYTAILGISSCMREMGRVADSRNWLEVAINGIERSCGHFSSEFASALLERSSFYSSINDQSLALEDALAAASIYESLYSDKSEAYAVALQNAGVYSLRQGNAALGIDYLNNSIQVLESLYGQSSELIGPYITIAESYLRLGDENNCNLFFKRAAGLINEFGLTNSKLGFSLYGSIGFHLLQNSDKASIDYLSKAIEIGKYIGIDKSPEYLYYNLCYNKALYRFDDNIIPNIEQLFASFTSAYYENFAYYLGGEREKYLSGKEFADLKNLLFCLGQFSADPTVLYDYLLLFGKLLHCYLL